MGLKIDRQLAVYMEGSWSCGLALHPTSRKGREASLDAGQFFWDPLGPHHHCFFSMCSSLFSHSLGKESDQLVGFFGLFSGYAEYLD